MAGPTQEHSSSELLANDLGPVDNMPMKGNQQDVQAKADRYWRTSHMVYQNNW